MPGSAPLYRAAAACPNSWKPPESTVTAKTSNSRCGRWKASYAAGPSPFQKNTQAVTARKPSTTSAIGSGRNRNRNGSVIRRVLTGSVTAYLSFSPSSGLDLFSGGSEPSDSLIRPKGLRCWSISATTISSETPRCRAWLTSWAISPGVRWPSTASRTA